MGERSGMATLKEEIREVWSVAKEADSYARRAAKMLADVAHQINDETETVYAMYAEKIALMSGRVEKRLDYTDAVDQVKTDLAVSDAVLQLEIAEETNDDGKLKFSNIEKRMAELEIEKAENSGILHLEATLRKAKRRLAGFDDETAQMERELRLGKYRLELQFAKLNALAGFGLR